MTFDDFGFEYEIMDGLDAMNFREPTPIQEKAIPVIMDGHDMIACAQTGTGKTAAFILPLMNNLLITGNVDNKVKAVIITPTRELAQQIDLQFEGFSYFAPISTVAVSGGGDGASGGQEPDPRGGDVSAQDDGRDAARKNAQAQPAGDEVDCGRQRAWQRRHRADDGRAVCRILEAGQRSGDDGQEDQDVNEDQGKERRGKYNGIHEHEHQHDGQHRPDAGHADLLQQGAAAHV